jgi:hypothetical protein
MNIEVNTREQINVNYMNTKNDKYVVKYKFIKHVLLFFHQNVV